MSHLTQNEVNLLIDWIAASDDLKDVINSGVKGWLATDESKAEMAAQDAIHRYATRTGRYIGSLVGLYAGNVWN